MTARAHGKITDIEVLRAVAVLFVLGHHIPALLPWEYFSFPQRGMWSGVDLFFCISGYVIARTLIPEMPGGRSLKDFLVFAIPFWIRRAWRILPSAYLWLAIMLLCTVFFNKHGYFLDIKSNFYDAVSAVLQVANLHFYNCAKHGAGQCGYGAIYWTLSLEEQFYILLPFVIFLLPRKIMLAFLAVACIAQLLHPHQHWVGLHAFLRTESFLLGVLIAYLRHEPVSEALAPKFLAHPLAAYAAFGVLTFLLFFAGHQDVKLVPAPMALTSLVCGLWVFIASYNRAYVLPDNVIKPLLLWVGSRSYAIYLIHAIVFRLTRTFWQDIIPAPATSNLPASLVYGGTALVLVVLLSEANYRFVELPLRHRGKHIARNMLDRIRKSEHSSEKTTAAS